MSSHVRWVLKAGGQCFHGHEVKSYLRDRYALPLNTQKEFEAAAKELKCHLFLIRQPRKAKPLRSKYKRICQAYGFRFPKSVYAAKAKKKANNAKPAKVPAGGHAIGGIAVPDLNPFLGGQLENVHVVEVPPQQPGAGIGGVHGHAGGHFEPFEI